MLCGNWGFSVWRENERARKYLFICKFYSRLASLFVCIICYKYIYSIHTTRIHVTLYIVVLFINLKYSLIRFTPRTNEVGKLIFENATRRLCLLSQKGNACGWYYNRFSGSNYFDKIESKAM